VNTKLPELHISQQFSFTFIDNVDDVEKTKMHYPFEGQSFFDWCIYEIKLAFNEGRLKSIKIVPKKEHLDDDIWLYDVTWTPTED
jgi:hypothetical protein